MGIEGRTVEYCGVLGDMTCSEDCCKMRCKMRYHPRPKEHEYFQAQPADT